MASNNIQEPSLLLHLLPTELILQVLQTLDFRTLLLCQGVGFMSGSHRV